MRLDGSKEVWSVKSTWSILHPQYEAQVLPFLEGNKGCKANTHACMFHNFLSTHQMLLFPSYILCKNDIE